MLNQQQEKRDKKLGNNSSMNGNRSGVNHHAEAGGRMINNYIENNESNVS